MYQGVSCQCRLNVGTGFEGTVGYCRGAQYPQCRLLAILGNRPLSRKDLLRCADGVRSIWVNESLFARVEEPAVACDSLRPPGMEEMGWESAISVAELQARSLGQSPHAVEH